jgi:transcriptional regulator with XRE-family HTH domain
VPAPDQRLAAVLARLRGEQGMTQEDLAFASELSLGALSRIERGLNDPHWTTVLRIAEALEVGLGEIVDAVEATESA